MSLTSYRLIETLKRIGYPDADDLKAADCDWICEDEELKCLFEAICDNVTPENVLTPQEVKEYEKFQVVIATNPSLMKKIELMDDFLNPDEEKEVLDDLQGSINNMSKYIKNLEHQANILSQHKMKLVEELKESEKIHRNLQHEIRLLQSDLLPTTIKKLQNSIRNGIRMVDRLDEVFCSDKDNIKPLYKENLKPYLASEEELLQNVIKFLTKDFQQFVEHSEKTTVTPKLLGVIPELSMQQLEENHADSLCKMQIFLHKVERESIDKGLQKIDRAINSNSAEEAVFAEMVMSYLPEDQLEPLLEKAKALLKEQEAERLRLMDGLRDLIQSNIRAQCEYVAFLCNKEKLNRLENYLQWLQKPYDILIEQNARLQMLQIALNIQDYDLKNLQKAIASFRSNVEEDVKTCTKNAIEETRASHVDNVEDNAILDALKNLLKGLSTEDISFLSNQNVVQKYKEQMEAEANTASYSDKFQADLQEWMKMLEIGTSAMEEHLFDIHLKDGDHSQHMLDHLNSSFNKFSWLIQQFEVKLLEKMTDYQKRKEIISQNQPLSKARYLFIYAITNQAKFLKLVEDILADVSHVNS